MAGFAEDAPALFNGDRVGVQAHAHKNSDGTVNLFTNPSVAQGDFTGPLGFTIGSRNNLRGPSAFSMDMGLGKTFPIYGDKVNLKFRADAFNVLNHPVFSTPTTANIDITGGSAFGRITTTSSSARVGQFALRLEF